MHVSSKVFPILVCCVSCVVLGFVFLMEYAFEIKPCEWCVYQRYPYVFLLVLNLIWCIRPETGRIQNVINTFLLTINAVLPLIHVLIEKGYVHVKCSVLRTTSNESILQSLGMLMTHRSCVKINWVFLGWSMAQWHLLFAGSILISYVWSVVYVQKQHS